MNERQFLSEHRPFHLHGTFMCSSLCLHTVLNLDLPMKMSKARELHKSSWACHCDENQKGAGTGIGFLTFSMGS